ncbi:unnamed protein product [Ilex paraguariensis]|uniref:Uncharacterized protein n=1 Tax=Ilex paraguariensis TaxID=185542 RepID=A0ABC8TNE5_9AQUA
MFAVERSTDDMFGDRSNLNNYVMAAFLDQVAEIMDPILVEEINLEEEITMFGVGVACSKHSPGDQMNISDAIFELYSIKDAIL